VHWDICNSNIKVVIGFKILFFLKKQNLQDIFIKFDTISLSLEAIGYYWFHLGTRNKVNPEYLVYAV
jgi:hypothetical protein